MPPFSFRPSCNQPATVLAAVKTASRRLRRWPAASLDSRFAPWPLDLARPGRKNAQAEQKNEPEKNQGERPAR